MSKPVLRRASADGAFGGATGVQPFELRVLPHRDAVHVVPVGELDIATAPALRGAVDELVGAGFQAVVVDLRELSFIDCAGLSVLRALSAGAGSDGWDLSIIQGPSAVRRVFTITKTLDTLPFA